MYWLAVIYDSRCGLCSHLADWLSRQPAYVRLQTLPHGSEECRRRFPSLRVDELAVVGDSGEVWLGDRAWIMVLWALREYRRWARRLSSPALLPLVRQAVATLSQNRKGLSHLLGLRSEDELKRHLDNVTVPPCRI